MANYRIIPIDTLRQLLTLVPETGELFWKQRPVELFKTKRDCNAWNTRYAGTRAFNITDKHGYLCGHISKIQLKASRVIWAITHGKWPNDEIDHVRGKTKDNRPTKLRDVSHGKNQKNCKTPKDNKSGAIGIFWRADRNRWLAYIRSDNRRIHLGHFINKTDAIAARKQAEIKYNFHPNHGRNAA